MNKNLLVTLFVFSVPFSLLSSEPSAFGAGNLDSSSPYGLTTNEKVILENKNILRKVEVKSNNQANEVESLRERLDGLQSIIENLSRKTYENKVVLERMEQNKSANADVNSEYEKRLGGLSQSNSESIEKMKVILTELSVLVDSINAKYVTKDEFNSLVSSVNEFKSLVGKELKVSTPTKASSKTTAAAATSLESMSNIDIANEAQSFYDKKNYTSAIEYYTYLLEKNYKPAYANYMLGEMNYKRKNHNDAIAYYKQSATLYSDASYMPNLMLNTAASMAATGDKANAKTFYKALVAKYPNSLEAKKAQKQLNSIK
ncbi:MAG: tetratricopeptide repeat protein [Sulfurimonas sp.]|nr:tetratricopeptide repeat protein [Sulfurimonas sp.]MDD3059472.1 tetratricopeptide repeat protein [Sulfurimonas sp.]MDD5202595.1 tetratricopeptide repeat protein [Sulfurimonas sp.]